MSKFVRIVGMSGPRWGDLNDDGTISCLDMAPWINVSQTGENVNAEDVTFLPPAIPGKVIGVAGAFRNASGYKGTEIGPVAFLKSPHGLLGTGDIVKAPIAEMRIWGEPELGLVIGRKVSRESAEDVANAIFGYLLCNDFTSENPDGYDHHLAQSKASDGLLVVGRWIDCDFVPGNQQIVGKQDGRNIRIANLSDRVWGDCELVAWLSTWITLEPGDLILTGTPGRVGDEKYLEIGSEFECQIETLDTIRNKRQS